MNIVKLNIANRHELLKCYIKQFKLGGLFVKGKYDYQLGDKVFLLVTLMETNESLAINGVVGWVSTNLTAGYPEGVGCQFDNDKSGIAAKNKIEMLLGSALNKDYNSYTF